MIEAIIAAVVVLVCAGVFVYIRFFRKPAPSVPQTQEQVDHQNNPRS